MRKQQAVLTRYREDICSAINNESASVSELANQFRVDKSLLITRIRSWKNQGLISRNVTVHMNGNISKPTVTQASLASVATPPKNPKWWETDLGLQSLDQSEFKYTDSNSPVIETARYLIYTDGSCILDPDNRTSDGPGGWAVVLIDRKENRTTEFYGCSQQSTANKMELTAILEAVKVIGSEQAVIFTDSQFAAKSVSMIDVWRKNGWRTDLGRHPLGLDILLNLYGELQGKQVDVQWLKGHNNDEHNSRCDLLANAAARKQIVCPYTEDTSINRHLTLTDATARIGCSLNTIRRLIDRNALTVIKPNKHRVLVLENEVDAVKDLRDQGIMFSLINRSKVIEKISPAPISANSHIKEVVNNIDSSAEPNLNKWTSAKESARLLEIDESTLSILVGRGILECTVKDGKRVYNTDEVDLGKVAEVLDEINEEDSAASDIIGELNSEIKDTSELAQDEVSIPEELDDMQTGEDVKNEFGITEEILDRLVETNKVTAVGFNGTKYYNTREIDKAELLYSIEEIRKVLTSQGSGELAQEPELVAVEVDDKEDDDMKCECSAEEKRFAEFYVRYGAAMTAKKLGCTEEDVQMKWADFMIDYDVELSITKRN